MPSLLSTDHPPDPFDQHSHWREPGGLLLTGLVGGGLVTSPFPSWLPQVLAALWAGAAVAVALRAACTTGAKHDAAMATLSVWLPWPAVVDVVRRRGGPAEQTGRHDNGAAQSD